MERPAPALTVSKTVQVSIGSHYLEGNLNIPSEPLGVVLFAHGSGSSRHSPRNQHVANALNHAHLGTLLIDLLTPEEEMEDRQTAALRFDLDLLSRRLAETLDWLHRKPETRNLSVGLFGASTGGGAAIMAAAERPESVSAIVSRGGRPDLAGDALDRVTAPVLLIVGGADYEVLELNRTALARIAAPIKELAVVRGASHLFEERGTLDEVARLATVWFTRYLKKAEPV